MTDDPNFSKHALINAAILLTQSSVEGKNFVKLKETELNHLVIKLTKPSAVSKACFK